MTAGATLEQLLRRAKAIYDALPPAAREHMEKQQRRSWTIGQLGILYPNISRENIAAIVDKVLEGEQKDATG